MGIGVKESKETVHHRFQKMARTKVGLTIRVIASPSRYPENRLLLFQSIVRSSNEKE